MASRNKTNKAPCSPLLPYIFPTCNVDDLSKLYSILIQENTTETKNKQIRDILDTESWEAFCKWCQEVNQDDYKLHIVQQRISMVLNNNMRPHIVEQSNTEHSEQKANSETSSSFGSCNRETYSSSRQSNPDQDIGSTCSSLSKPRSNSAYSCYTMPTCDSIQSSNPNSQNTFTSDSVVSSFLVSKEITVVIIGETRVGKTTFINAISNYLKYRTMNDAIQRGVEILIETCFSHVDNSNYKTTQINCDPTVLPEDGPDYLKCYTFVWKYGKEKIIIRIIDTPSINIREQKKENFQRLLSNLAGYRKINAICILLNCLNAKFTYTWENYMEELLKHFRVFAPNIIFCFTTAKVTFYGPGETFDSLKSYLNKFEKKQGISIPYNNNVFFFDNESFQYLCARKQGANFNEKEMSNFNDSWMKSKDVTLRLFSYISELNALEVNNSQHL